MTETLSRFRSQDRLAAAPAAGAALLEPLMDQAAGPGATSVSLSLDFGVPAKAGDEVVTEAWVERATRTLVFVHGRITLAGDEALVLTASGVYRRLSTG
jgi:acyl-coenzyme A thioesterase PaaI-like protein